MAAVKAEMHLPEWLRKTQGHDMPTGAYSMPISWDDVRLVYALENPKTGDLEDVIIENLELKEFYTDPDTLETEYKRVCPDLDGQVIEWADKPEPQKQDHDGDTLRITVEQRTWLPTLNESPFPESVIDELRNRYSKYRVPDNNNFVRLKQQHEENKKTRNIEWMKAMRTPLQELHALQAHQRREELREKGLEAPMPEVELKRGKRWNWKAGRKEDEPIDEEFLARIGSMLAEKKGTSALKGQQKPQRVVA